MKRRDVALISRSELKNLPTHRLLSYLHRLQKCEDSPDKSDMTSLEVASTMGKIIFKSSDEWRLQYELVKSILKKRAHIERK